MTDEVKAPQPPEPTSSYRTCEACGCQVHQSRNCCPECGAFPHEDHPPAADTRINATLTLVLVLILGAALFALSKNREAAAADEAEKFSRLTLSDPEPQTDPIVARPTSTPAPVVQSFTPPVPTPTSIPIAVENIQAQPTAKPNPFQTQASAFATPTPRPLPTSTPVPAPPSTLDLKDKLVKEFRDDLDERYPMAEVGQFIRLTMRDSRVITGTIASMEANQLVLQSPNGQRWVLYRLLSRESRMRVDKIERETWAEEKALEEVLKRLQN